MKMPGVLLSFFCLVQLSYSGPLLAPRSGLDNRQEQPAAYDIIRNDINTDFFSSKSLGVFIVRGDNKWSAFYISPTKNKKERLIFVCKGWGYVSSSGQVTRRSLDIDSSLAGHLYSLFRFHISLAANRAGKTSLLDDSQVEYWIEEDGQIRSGFSCSPDNDPPALERVLSAMIDLVDDYDSEQPRRMAELKAAVETGLQSIRQHLPARHDTRGPRK